MACSAADRHEPAPSQLDETPPVLRQTASATCRGTDTGCPCPEEGESVACGDVKEQRGAYVICSMGSRSCTGGTWGECQPSGSSTVAGTEVSGGSHGLRLQALSSAKDCENLCDPRCMSMVDTPDGLVVPDDLLADPSGLTLPGGTGGGSCSDLSIVPASPTVTITQIAANGAVTASPATLSLSASCSGGASVQPSWTIDAYDRAVVDGEGEITVFSGIASPILATAESSADTSTALVNVVVRIEDRGSDTTVASAFDGTPVADTGTASKTLYPYKNTVFPLDLGAPLVQWDKGSNAATAVRVMLRSPARTSPGALDSGTTLAAGATFWYSKIYNLEPKLGTVDLNQPAWKIPQEIWSAFDRSAQKSANGGEIVVQRYYGAPGQTRPAMSIPVKFGSKALSGTVYYTQYQRNVATSTCPTSIFGAGQANINAATYTPGNMCPVGMCTIPPKADGVTPIAGAATTRAIDLSTPTALNKDPFNGAAGCPACHSVSANGDRYVSANQAQQTMGGGSSKGVDRISLDASGNPTFTALGTAPNYTGDTTSVDPNGEASYGFSFGALTPDGLALLQGANYWGGSIDTPATNNTQDAAMKGLTGSIKPHFFVNPTNPGAGVQFATTAALPANNASGTDNIILTATANAALSIDGQALANGNAVLVKDEASTAKNGVYTVTNAGSGAVKWVLTRRSDANTAAELVDKMDVRVSDGVVNRGRSFVLSWASATHTLGTTGITFAERSPVIHYTSSAALVAKCATTLALPANARSANVLTANSNGVFPTIDGQTLTATASPTLNDVVLVKNEATPVNNGLYYLSTAGTAAIKWKLTRYATMDSGTEAAAGTEVNVTSGTLNGGRRFNVAALAAGAAITINTNNIVFKSLTLPAMMVPTFSPNGLLVAYVNADADPIPGVTDVGWRRGLSMFSVSRDTSTPPIWTLSSKKRLLTGWNSTGPSTPIKWPFFEPDNHSLLYVRTDANEFCDANANAGHCAGPNTNPYATDSCTADGATTINTNIERACFQGSRGSMTPTTRGFWPGRIYSLDSTAATPATTEVELAKLNDGDDDGGADDATDADKSYQPTVLPFDVGGYRWVIFTSPRPYGNQFNAKGTHFSCGASMLWVAALDNTAAAGTDRSHPAFFLPGQNIKSITAAGNHFVNERGYLVPSLCKNAGSSCTSNDDCCGASTSPTPTAACRAPTGWSPADGPPAKTCAALSGTCGTAGDSCSSPADCCDSAPCVDFACAAPPSFEQADFQRDYEAVCPADYRPSWQLLSYYLTTDSDSRLDFSIQTANDVADLDLADSLALEPATDTVLSPDKPAFQDVGAVLNKVHSNGKNHLRLLITFVPSKDGQSAPVLHDWEVRYTCEPAQ